MSGRGALLLTLASVLASALNYFYQVQAAALLDVAAFGLLSAWLARVTLLGAVATVVQFLSLDHPLGEARFRGLLRGAGIASLALLVAQIAFGERMSTSLLGVAAVASGIVLYAVVGQLQARLELGMVGGALLASAALRFALPLGWGRAASGFYVSHAAAGFAGVLAAAALVGLRGSPRAPAAPAVELERRRRLGRPVLLALASVLFPILDVLIVSSTQDATTTGAFSRVQLTSRVVFFAGAAALQVLLPHQLHAATHGRAMPPFARRLEWLLTPGMLAGAVVLATLVDRVILHPSSDERLWLYASSLSAALLVTILGDVNRLAARDRLGLATACVAGVVLTSVASAGLAALWSDHRVTRYTLGVLVGDGLVLAFARAAQMRSRPAAPVR